MKHASQRLFTPRQRSAFPVEEPSLYIDDALGTTAVPLAPSPLRRLVLNSKVIHHEE